MNKERLLILANFLETRVPRRRFDYSTIVGLDWKGMGDLSCGTVGCALGWAAVCPELKEAGMQLPLLGKKDEYGHVLVDGTAVFAIAREVFDLNDDESQYLFQPGWRSEDYAWDVSDDGNEFITSGASNDLGWSADQLEVAAHIRHFVENGGIQYVKKKEIDE